MVDAVISFFAAYAVPVLISVFLIDRFVDNYCKRKEQERLEEESKTDV